LGGIGNTFVKLNNDATHLYTLGGDIILQEDAGEEADLGAIT
jgi:hypothetical protein